MPEKVFKKQPTYLEEYNENATEIYEKLSNANDDVRLLSNDIAGWFNQNTDEKTRIKNEINKISSEVAMLRFALSNDTRNCTVFNEEFNSYDNIDFTLSGDKIANISTAEGILTLSRSSANDISSTVSLQSATTGGTIGNGQVVEYKNQKPFFVSATSPHNTAAHMLDGKPETWVEWQMVNITDEDKRKIKFDYQWAKGSVSNDSLQLKLILQLTNASYINFISISPYVPAQSDNIVVASIRLSENGVDYNPIDKNNPYLNTRINVTNTPVNKAATANANEDREKYKSQGQFFFDAQLAKYIEIVLIQQNPYSEKIGHIYYVNIAQNSGKKETRTRAAAKTIPSTITDPKVQPGRYTYKVKKDGKDVEVLCEKGIEVLNGWRYCIGLKDISVSNYQYNTQSQIITKQFTTEKPIKAISIESEEIIHEKLTELVGSTYGFIQYYISIDDINWTEILPIQRQAVFGNDVPKIVEINKTKSDLLGLNATQIITPKDAYQVRVKIVLRTDAGMLDVSPILEGYTLKLLH